MRPFPLRALVVVALCLMVGAAHATELGLRIVKQPIYLHGADTDVEIKIMDVPVATAGSLPESDFAAISAPFIPTFLSSWTKPRDVNLASIYAVHVSAFVEANPKIPEWTITIDASKAKVPEGYPFSIDEVIDATRTCVKLMCPIAPSTRHKITIKTIPAAAQ